MIKTQRTKTDWSAVRKALKDTHGNLKDYSVEEIAPSRKKGAWRKFGDWDKDIDFSKLK